jgi:hypothetical protein
LDRGWGTRKVGDIGCAAKGQVIGDEAGLGVAGTADFRPNLDTGTQVNKEALSQGKGGLVDSK